MGLKHKVMAALKDAMRAKDQISLSTLRLINAAIKDREIALRGAGPDAHEGELGETDILTILAKMVKQRQESARAYEEAGRLELAEQEQAEIKVIERFLPKALSDSDVSAAIDAAIAATGATSLRNMGAVMAALKAEYTGRMDFGAVGAEVRKRLG